MAAVATQEVILVIIDISGYTKFMIDNRNEVHSQLVIGRLIGELIDQIALPFRISKLEGDAIFLYVIREHAKKWDEEKHLIGEKLEMFFGIFSESLIKLSGSKLCSSALCRSLNKLKLKMFVHYGHALFQTIRGYQELAGVDVIMVHRLLKNRVKADHYLLITQSALQELSFPHPESLTKHVERDSELGKIDTHVYVPPKEICQVHN